MIHGPANGSSPHLRDIASEWRSAEELSTCAEVSICGDCILARDVRPGPGSGSAAPAAAFRRRRRCAAARTGARACLDSADVTTADQTESARSAGPPPAGRHELPPQYVPGEVESRRYEGWVQAGYFTADADSPAPPFTIMIPPPNVTGSLHIGHALDHTLIDALVRRRRMQGYNTLWLPGMDHAGIATQNVVERELAKEGASRHDLGREAFVERVWQWKAEYGGRILGQMRKLGDSVDWTRERFTMDEGLSRAVQTIFKRLFDDGLIYRADRIINWCPRCMTALSDIEVDHSDDEGELVSIRYGDGDSSVVVATTRVETMLGDTAVAVHPDDPRYTHLVGTTVELPLTGRHIPVVADPHVDPEFGTGAVKVTPAHDPDDFEIGRRHDLPSLTVMDERGVVTASGPFEGLDRFEARPAVLAALRAEGRVVAEIRPYVHAVGHCDRCGTTVEPRLSLQWFVKVGPLAKAAGDAVRDGRVRIYPGQLAARYFDWVDDMHDWCISRQLWWGHRIPAWYDAAGRVYVGRSEAEVRAAHGLGEEIALRRDEDVLDTWFSSALWPFSTQGWPQPTAAMSAYYPTSVLVTGFDIIFFWVARMIMMGLKFTGEVPFREIYVHGLIRDHDGQKMSKSKGNVIDPLDIVDGIGLEALIAKRTAGLMQPQMKPAIERATRKQFPQGIAAFGTDALRMCFASLATQSRDLRFDTARVEGYRNFCNKLWNAARYVTISVDGAAAGGDAVELGVADRWIRSRLGAALARAQAGFADYRLDTVVNALYEFTWHEFCDWYVELSKTVLQSDDSNAAQKHAVRHTLVGTLETLLRALHPLAPFISEEIWQRVRAAAGAAGETVMLAPYPQAADFAADPEAEREMAWVRQFILGVRQIRGEMDIAPSRKIDVVLQDAGAADLAFLARNMGFVRRLAGIEVPRILEPGRPAPVGAVALLGSLQILVPMAGLIEPSAEKERLAKRQRKAETDLQKLQAKAANADFARNAPAEVVARDRARIAELQTEIGQLQAQAARIRALLQQ
ncbi:MAG TPA: valine--tRNA ligase [Steroidobacteraceae bacterium]|nr:valine--tRNA ligase [Steroidobacteraceae bacterium]